MTQKEVHVWWTEKLGCQDRERKHEVNEKVTGEWILITIITSCKVPRSYLNHHAWVSSTLSKAFEDLLSSSLI